MNILYYLKSFPKLSQSFVLNEIYELHKLGHDLVVIANHDPGHNYTHSELDELDLPIHYLSEPRYRDIYELLSPTLLSRNNLRHRCHFAPLDSYVGTSIRAKRAIEYLQSIDFKPDIVHTHFANYSQFGARYIASTFDAAFTITTHAFDLYKKPISRASRLLLHSVDRIVTISEYNRKHIRNEFVKDTPIDVVHAGIRPEKFSPSQETVDDRVFTVARFVEKKGLEYAIEAIAKLVVDRPHLSYHIVGSGPLEEKLRALVSKHGLDQNIEFLDNVSDERLIREFDEAQCFLLPSVIADSGDRDGIPVALMESMAMNTPPISTTVSGIPELIKDGQSGLLVPPRDVQATAKAIRTMLGNTTLRKRCMEAGRETVCESFNSTVEAKKLSKIFESAQAEY